MPHQTKRATVSDVAKLAGVSVATVSRVINDSDYPISPTLRKRVLDAAEALDYVPNATARSLKGGANRDIGVILPNITNPFYIQTLRGIDSFIMEHGFQLLLCNTQRQVERERAVLRSLYERRVQRVILSSVDDQADTVMEYTRRGMKFVLLDQRLKDANCAMIHYDTREGARLAVRHLIECGHRAIALATTPPTRWTRKEMREGYRETLRQAGLSFDERLIFSTEAEYEKENVDYDLGAGNALARMFVKDRRGATAVLCVNDMVAFGFIRSLAGEGIRVPGDVSVIGFDDVPLAATFLPALTTVRYPSYETGRLAIMMLLDSLTNEKDRHPLRMQLDPQLIIRDTVMRVE